MDNHPADQNLPHIPGLPKENQEQKLGPVPDAGEQAPSLPFQQIQDEDADTDPTDAHRAATISAPSDQDEVQLQQDFHTHGSGRNSSGPEPCSPDQSQHVTASGLAHQTNSFTPPIRTQSDHSDVSATMTPTPSNPDLTSSNAKLQYPPPLKISESLGLEGCAGIIGGFVGILGVWGFLTFLWFGGRLPFPFTPCHSSS